LGVDESLTMFTLLILDGAEVELVKRVLVRYLLEVKLGLVDLP